MRIFMKSCPDKQCTKKPFVYPTNVQIHRPCIDSLRIPNKFNRPCIMPHQAQTESPCTSCCKNSCGLQHPICHCVDQNAPISETCNSSTNRTRSRPPYSSYGFEKDDNLQDNSIIENGEQLFKENCKKADGYNADVSCKDSGYDNQQDALDYIQNTKNDIQRSLVSFAPSCNQNNNCRKSGRCGILSVVDQTNRNVNQNADNIIRPTSHVQNINNTLNIQNANDFCQSVDSETDNINNNNISNSTRLTELSGSRQDVNKTQISVQNAEKNFLETNDNLSDLNPCRQNYNPAHTLYTSPPEYTSKILRNKTAQSSTSSVRNTSHDSNQYYYNLPSGPSNRRDDYFEPVCNNSVSFRSVENSASPTNIQLQNSPSENMCQQYKMTPNRFAGKTIASPRADATEKPTNEFQQHMPRTFSNKTIQNQSKLYEKNDQQSMRRDKTDLINPYYERESPGSSIFHTPIIHSGIDTRQTPFMSVDNSYSKRNAQVDVPSIQEQSHADLKDHVEARLTTKDNISQNNIKSNALCSHRTDAQPTEAMSSTPLDFSIFKEHIAVDNCSSPAPIKSLITSKLPRCCEQDEVFERLTPSRANSSEVPVCEKQCGMHENFTSSQTRHDTAATRDSLPNKTVHKVPSACACFDKAKKSQTILDAVQCRQRGTCTHNVGALSCTSTSCVINQISGCPCRYPPAFQQFSCTGNISGCCNCKNNH